MDFMRILRSLEEFLYEVMTWLVFYPRTLWAVIRRPLATMRYSDTEQAKPEDEQYLDLLSPVLFLMLSLLIVHAAELVTRSDDTAGLGGVFAPIMRSDLNLLLLRSIVFSIFPLMFALAALGRSDGPLDRNSLRGPFLAQCFTGGLFASVVSFAAMGMRNGPPPVQLAGLAAAAAALAWYLAVQSRWLAERLSIGRWPAIGLALRAFAQAGAVVVAATLVLFAT